MKISGRAYYFWGYLSSFWVKTLGFKDLEKCGIRAMVGEESIHQQIIAMKKKKKTKTPCEKTIWDYFREDAPHGIPKHMWLRRNDYMPLQTNLNDPSFPSHPRATLIAGSF